MQPCRAPLHKWLTCPMKACRVASVTFPMLPMFPLLAVLCGGCMLAGRSPRNVKVLLRAAQATIGLGPGEYSAAAQLLQQALEHAKEQQLPIRGERCGSQRLQGTAAQHEPRMMLCPSAWF